MTPAAILNEARAAGVTLWGEGGTLRYRGPRVALTKLLPTLKAHKGEVLNVLEIEQRLTSQLNQACQGLLLTAVQFRSLLTADDLADIEGGYVPLKTLRAYAESFAQGIRLPLDLRRHDIE